MAKYMVVIKDGEKSNAYFFQDYVQAENCRQGVECGLGLYAELYAYQEPEGYVCIA